MRGDNQCLIILKVASTQLSGRSILDFRAAQHSAEEKFVSAAAAALSRRALYQRAGPAREQAGAELLAEGCRIGGASLLAFAGETMRAVEAEKQRAEREVIAG